MSGTYSAALVAASVLIAVFASLVALALASRVTAAQGRLRVVWLAGGSLALGTGIWSMHFLGMLAYRLPVPMSYDIYHWLLSLAVAVAASGVALHTVARSGTAVGPVLAGGLLMGPAIAGMHYLGMRALHVTAHVTYDASTVAASAAVAVTASMAALWLAFRFRDDAPGAGMGERLGAATVMGVGIAGMHYTGMAAARFHPEAAPAAVPETGLLATEGLAVWVGVGTATVLALALAVATVDRRMRARTAENEALRRSRERFRSLVSAVAQVVWTADAGGAVAEEQPQWAAFTGSGPDEYGGMGWLESIHPDDRPRAEEDWRRGVAEGTRWETDFRLRRADGQYRRLAVRCVPVLESDGRVREWVAAGSDVTERRRDEAIREFLAEASRTLASSLDYHTTLAAVARLAVPTLADWCAVDLLEHGRRHRVAVMHSDPERLRLVREIARRWPGAEDAPLGVPAVLRSGRPELVADIPDSLLEQAAQDPEHLAAIRRLGLRSYLIVPLEARGRILGALTLALAESARRHGQRDLALAEELARRASVAIDNALLFRETEEARAQLERQAAELEEAQAEMQMAHDELRRTNDQLLARTAEAERARTAADAANQAKSDFLATMSHELRTPLNAIGGYAQLMEMGIQGPVTAEQLENLEKIRRNQTHLLGLINDVLNFAKIEAGQVQYRMEPVAVDETLASLEALVEPQIRARELRYVYRGGDPAVRARADRERLEQVILNLLTNAVKFTEPGGEVVLEWEAAPDRVVIRVRDSGRGIPAAKLDAIFEPFVQVEPTLTRSSEGTGLGLAISRDLARAMGGDLLAESREGEGSAFTLVLERAAAGSREAA